MSPILGPVDDGLVASTLASPTSVLEGTTLAPGLPDTSRATLGRARVVPGGVVPVTATPRVARPPTVATGLVEVIGARSLGPNIAGVAGPRDRPHTPVEGALVFLGRAVVKGDVLGVTMGTDAFLRPEVVPSPDIHEVGQTLETTTHTATVRRRLPARLATAPIRPESPVVRQVGAGLETLARNVGLVVVDRPLVAIPEVPRPSVGRVPVALEILPTKATRTKILGLVCRPAVRAGRPVVASILVALRVSTFDGASRLVRPYKAKTGTASIPRPAMARRMATEADGLGGVPATESPPVAGTLADAVVATGHPETLGAPVPLLALEGTRIVAGNAAPATLVGAVAAPVAWTPVLLAGHATVAVAPTSVVVRLLGVGRLDGAVPPTDACDDAVAIPFATRAGRPAQVATVASSQIAARAMGRLVRMEGMAAIT